MDIELLKKKYTLTNSTVSFVGHAYAREVRQVFLDGHLKVVKVEYRGDREMYQGDKESDFNNQESIRTFDHLAFVSLRENCQIEVRIRDGEGLTGRDMGLRSIFTLEGSWWLLGFTVERIEHNWYKHTNKLVALEELKRLEARRQEVEAQVLAGTYVVEEEA